MEDMQIENQGSNEEAEKSALLTNGDDTVEKATVDDSYIFNGKIVQVTNVSTGATLQQLATLFGFLGTVTDIRMYPLEANATTMVKLCYIKYENSDQCGVAQHLTNTVFIDKPLIVVPLNREEIPEESECQNLIKTINAYATSAGSGFLPQYFPPEDSSGIPGLPPPPIITSTTDPVEIDEIKKTVFVENIAEDITSEQLMAFFSGIGEVKYLRYCTKDKRYCFIEFSNLQSVPTALQYNGVLFGGKCLKVSYSKGAIVKPESERIATGRNTARKSTRDAVKRPSSADRSGGDTWDSTKPRVLTSRSRSRSRSRSKRSRSRDRRRRSKTRSRSPRRRRSRSSSPPRRRRRSKSRSKSPIRSRRRSRSRSKSKSPRRRRSRSRSRERRRRRRSPSKSVSRSPRRRKKKSKSRSPSPHKKKSSRRSISRSPDRSSKKKKKDKDKDKSKDKDKGKEKEKEKEKSKKDKKEKEVEEKELKTLLTKIYTFEEEKEKEKKKSDE